MTAMTFTHNTGGWGRRWARAALTITVAAVTATAITAPTRHTTPVTAATVHTTGTATEIAGLDLHDGMAYTAGGTYYLVGTRYGCGFQWGIANTPFCGFGYATAPALTGPWTYQGLLTDPGPWQQTCGATGAGCFNPRMIQRGDGVWILYFNAPAISKPYPTASPYIAMGCNGPAGPCGTAAGPPHGSTQQMPMTWCSTAGGDFDVFTDGSNAWMACTASDQSITIEQLTEWWTGGVGGAHVQRAAGLTAIETPGVFRLPTGWWVMTFSDPNCGYCAGSATSYAISDRPIGTWTAEPNPAAVDNGAGRRGRREISGTTCGGQARTVFTIDGQVYELVDYWYGQRNETNAGVGLYPLTWTGAALDETPTGTPRRAVFTPFDCGTT